MLYNSPYSDGSLRSFRISDITQSSNFSALEVGHSFVPRGMVQKSKRNVYIIHYIANGKGSFCNINFNKYDGYLVAPDEFEKTVSDTDFPYESYWIIFHGSASKDMLKSVSMPTHNSIFKSSVNQECMKIIHNALYNISPNNPLEEAFLIQSALYQIFSLHARSLDTYADFYHTPEEKLKIYIDTNFYRNISINELVKYTNYSRSNLIRLFKLAYNKTPLEYLIDVRIEKSKELLINNTNKLMINEIAQIVGFNDPLYFSRIFRSRVGISPSEYKKHNM